MDTIYRSPSGAECQCTVCDLFFSGESAFDKHWTKNGHVVPGEVGLVERESARGPVWGWPGMPAEALDARRAGGSNNRSPGLIADGQERESEGPGGNGAGINSRGAHGGILAICEACGREWERPAKRGRPARACGECRQGGNHD